jgi:hypothetical protein
MISSDTSQISVLIDDICMLRKHISIQRKSLELELDALESERACLVNDRTSTERLIELWKPLANASHAFGGNREYRAITQLASLSVEAEYDIHRVEFAKSQVGRDILQIDRTMTWAHKTDKLLRDYLVEDGWNAPFTTLAVGSIKPVDPAVLAVEDFPSFDPETPFKWRDEVIRLVFFAGGDEGGNGTEGNGGSTPKGGGSDGGTSAPKGGASGNGGGQPANGSGSGGDNAPSGGSAPLPEEVLRRLRPILEILFRTFWRGVKAVERQLERAAAEREKEAKGREVEKKDRESRQVDRAEKESYELDKERERRQKEADEDAREKRRGERREREGERDPRPERDDPRGERERPR